MKHYLISAFCFLTISTSAQVDIEHYYTDGYGNALGWTETGYSTFDDASSTWKLYDPSHNLTRSIWIPPVSGYTFYGTPSYYGTTLFNTDQTFEYLISYSSGAERIIKVLKDNGDEIWSKACNGCAPIITSVGGQPKLILYHTEWTEVYSLGGVWPLGMEEQNLLSNVGLYPNPSSSTVSIEAPDGGMVSLSDITGRTVLEVSAYAGETLTVPVAHLPAGTYLVSIDGTTMERLVVR